MSRVSGFVAVLGAAAIAAGIYLWWQHTHPVVPPPDEAAALAQAPAGPLEPPAPEPEIKYPIDGATPPDAPADSDVTDLGQAMTALLGRDTVLKFLQLVDFPRRVVATVDNLSRSHAAPTLWPVNVTDGKFSVDGANDNQVIGAANSARYRTFVAAAQAIDTGKLVALYVKLYPQFQKAYEDIGYPHGYFNDRLVAVLDNLLATPEPTEPVAVTLTQVNTPLKQPERPWVRYEYADDDLESLSAGQKILLRIGAANRKVLKVKLAEIRARITGSAALIRTTK